MKKIFLVFSLLIAGSSFMMNASTPHETDTTFTPALIAERSVRVKYRNYRGEVGVRTIIPLGELYWGNTEYHPHDQWLLKVWDVEKDAERIYAFKDILEFDCSL